jgi:hypothetical protein
LKIAPEKAMIFKLSILLNKLGSLDLEDLATSRLPHAVQWAAKVLCASAEKYVFSN